MKFQHQCPLIKFYRTTATIICLGTVYGCSPVTTTELSSGERDLLQSLKYLPSGPLQKILPNPGRGGASALLEIRRKVLLPSNSSALNLEKQRVWTKLIPIFILSHLYAEGNGSVLMSLTLAGFMLAPAQDDGSSEMGQSWPANTGLPRGSPPHHFTLHLNGS